jgi:hypothetical protein
LENLVKSGFILIRSSDIGSLGPLTFNESHDGFKKELAFLSQKEKLAVSEKTEGLDGRILFHLEWML